MSNQPQKRAVCPHCGLDAGIGPAAHAGSDGCIRALKARHSLYQQRIRLLVMDNIEEVKNRIGGVIGYKLNLNTQETENLMREIERKV